MGLNVTIYFMSGTGNSYRVASWVSDYCLQQPGTSSAVIPIERSRPSVEIHDTSEELLGIVMPTHAFTAPWHIIKYVLRLPFRRHVKAFCIATQGSIKAGFLFVPGLSGSGTFLISLILALKGYRVLGAISLDMPSNWMALHPSLSEAGIAALIDRSRPRALQFIERIFSGKSCWLTMHNLVEAVLGILLIPVSFIYLLAGRFYLAKLFFANEKCNGCGQCAENCLSGAIKMTGASNKRPYWRFRCESCMRCMSYCPRRAIEAGHSWAVLLYYVTSIPVAVYLFAWLEGISPGVAAFDNGISRRVISLLYLYASIFVSYWLFSLLIRIPVVNAIFAWTTFTRFYRRYREPETNMRALR